MNLIELSVKRPVLTTMLMLMFAVIGFFCYWLLPKESFPKIDIPVVTVLTRYEGAGPDEVQQLITKELEDEVVSVEGIKHLSGISQQGMSMVVAEFYEDVDPDIAAMDVRAKIDLVRQKLPESADDPITQKFDFSAMPVVQLAVLAPRSLSEVFTMADERIKDRFATIPGVASVELIGGHEREIHILIDQQRLKAYNLNISDIISAVAAANLEMPGGFIRQSSQEYNIRLKGKFANIDEIGNMMIKSEDQNIYLRNIAEIRDTYKDLREMARANGKICVGINIQKRSDGNTVQIDQMVMNKIDELKKQLPEDFEIIVLDRMAPWVTSSINNVFENMYVGVILTAIALFVFLHTFRGTVIVSLTMPISVLATFTIMFISGITLNMMSLMGLAMIVGVLVNNAILVLENITRYIHMGHDPEIAAVEGTSEIAIAVASTTLTNVVVFVPIAFMGGVIGEFFKALGLTATFATAVSLIVSFTLAPMMAAKMLTKNNTSVDRPGPVNAFGRWFDRGLEKLKKGYSHLLSATLDHRWKTFFVILFLLVGSFMLAGHIGAEFITPMDQGKFSVLVEMPTGTRLEETDKAVKKIEMYLLDKKEMPELLSYYVTIGSVSGGDIGGSSQSVNIAQVKINVGEKFDRIATTKEIMNRLRTILVKADIPGAKLKVFEETGGGGGAAAIQLDVTGDDLDTIIAFAGELTEIMKDPAKITGTVDVDTNYRPGQPEVKIIPDREKCRDYGINTMELSQLITASYEGLTVNEYREGAYDYDIRVRGDEDSRKTLNDIEALSIVTPDKIKVPLPAICEIIYSEGPSQLFRKDRQSSVNISCNASGRSAGQVATDMDKYIAELKQNPQYAGINTAYTGDMEQMAESFMRLGIALAMAIGLTYMLLASLLESFTQPLVIMFTLPLSLIGVFFALFILGGTFSIFSIMSIIMLVGLVINNSIVVLDYVNVKRKQGMDRREAILQAGTTRLRPILMANLTTIIALIPLAMGLGWGGEMRAPMAMVQIGGLISGGGLGLLIVPAIYTISDDFNQWIKHFFHHHN
ncbi:MAG: efflux RND transporter permease subunit [Phycisphaerae bacterium]|nr:efflux RND transporter permease subunit [Phycisphaerae bacterium]